MEINRRHSKVMLTMVILFVLAVIVAGGALGYFWYQKSHEGSDTNSGNSSNGGNITIDTAPKIETENVSTALMIPNSTSKPGDTIHASVLTMSVPKPWRTINSREATSAPIDSVYAESASSVLAHLVMVPESQPADPLLAVNSLSFYDVTNWLTKPIQGQRGTVTPATKAAYLQNISAMADGQPTDKSLCNKTYAVLDESICSNPLDAKPVSTSDSSLKGVVFFNTITQAATYDPWAFVFLTGKVNGEQILVRGDFHLLDSNSHNLSATDIAAIGAAWNSFKGGTIPADTQQLYQHVIDAMKSITIKAN